MSKIETRRMANLITIRDVCLPERDDANWKAGFLAGFFDTDGCYSGNDLRFAQTKDNGLLEVTHRYISDLGFRSQREDFRSTTGRSERVIGALEEKTRFLSTIQPALVRKTADLYGRRFPGKHGAKIDGIRRLGIRELVDIQTTSGTFIAAGIGTHNCYALTLAKRLKAMGAEKYQHDGDPRTSGPGFGITVHPDALELPYTWRTPRLVFVNSMSDLFHARVPVGFIREVLQVMQDTPQHTYQVLTKRSRRLLRLDLDWPANAWMGVSVENARMLSRVDDLRQVPAALRFLSCEPLLGPLEGINLTGIHWVIAGGESGSRARPLYPSWVADLRDTCQQAEVPFFFNGSLLRSV
jgi:protein gp37